MKYIRKFDSAAALQAALATLERPFVAWDSTTSTTNLEFGEETNTPTTEAPVQAHEYVDLGIVLNNKKILFATKNVGADTIYDYGNYYAWGETETKSKYSWSTYNFNPSGDGWTFTKYNDTDGKTILEPSDDVVAVEWGGQWRSPTGAELEALLNQTTNTWVTDYQGSGINGRVFTGTNGNTMFVPAAGYRYDTTFYGAGDNGGWWSSSLGDGMSHAGRNLFFYSSDCSVSNSLRYQGFPARGVFTEDV